MRQVSVIAGLALCLALGACGDDDDDGGGQELGSFDAVASGDYDDSFSGQALFDGDVDGVFGLGLFDGGTTAATNVVGFSLDDVQPGTGSYPVDNVNADTFGMFALLDIDGEGLICTGESGTLNITASSSSQVAGSFDVDASCTQAGDEVSLEVNISGDFDAEDADLDDVDVGVLRISSLRAVKVR